MKQKDLATALGISPAMVSRLVRRGMPVDAVDRAERWRRRHLAPARLKGARAGSGLAAPAAVELQARSGPASTQPPADSTYSVDRARRERYEADMAEIKLREQQGSLVDRAAVRTEMEARLGGVRANLLQIPARLAPLLAPEADQAKVHAMLDAELRAVLAKLAS